MRAEDLPALSDLTKDAAKVKRECIDGWIAWRTWCLFHGVPPAEDWSVVLERALSSIVVLYVASRAE